MICYAIQGITPKTQKEDENKRLRVIPALYLNIDFVTCMMGDMETAKILLAEGSVNALNRLNQL